MVSWEVLMEKALVLDQAGKPSTCRLLATGETSDCDDGSDCPKLSLSLLSHVIVHVHAIHLNKMDSECVY